MKKLLSTIATSTLFLSSLSFADTFEGKHPTAVEALWDFRASPANILAEEDDTENLFGKGRNNSILAWDAVDGQNKITAFEALDSNVVSINFKLYLEDQPMDTAFAIKFGRDSMDRADTFLQVGFQDGGIRKLGSYIPGEVFPVSVVANNSTNSVQVEGEEIPPFTYGLFVDGVLLGTPELQNIKSGEHIKSVELITFSHAGVKAKLDDVTIHNKAVVIQ